AFRSDVSEMILEKPLDGFRLLVRHQAHRNLGVGFGRQYRFGAFARISAPDTVHIQGGPDSGPFNAGISLFTPDLADCQVLVIPGFVKGRFVQLVALGRTEIDNLVVKTWNGDPVLFIVQGSDHFAEDIDGVGYRSPVYPAMEIPVGPGYFHFHVGHAPQSG